VETASFRFRLERVRDLREGADELAREVLACQLRLRLLLPATAAPLDVRNVHDPVQALAGGVKKCASSPIALSVSPSVHGIV
jgi:hypothetical protein